MILQRSAAASSHLALYRTAQDSAKRSKTVTGSQTSRRVVITGMGAMTSLGNSVPSIWEAVLAGQSGIRYIQQFDSRSFPVRIAGEVDLHAVPMPDLDSVFPGCGRAAHFGWWATKRAWEDAGIAAGTWDPSRAGICIGASTFPVIEDRLDKLGELLEDKGWNRSKYLELCRSRPQLLRQSDAAAISTLLSQQLKFQGPSLTVQAACASATQAIGHAFRSIQAGQTDLMLTGGTDSMVSMMCVTGFTLLGSLSQRWSTPAQASRPFDRTRDGFVLAEGAAMLVLEELEQALQRGANIYAELVGYGSSCDAYRFTDVHPEGAGAAQCMQAALQDAGIDPEQIGYINAHGTSTLLNDSVETLAIRRVFGNHAERLAVSSTKSQLGHLLCAAGGIELLLSTLALKTGIIPATINLDHPDPQCDLDYVPWKPRSVDVRFALSNSFGFGGQNGSLVLRRWDKTPSVPLPRVLPKRVLVTGLGIISPLGLNVHQHFKRLCRGESAVGPVSTPELAGLSIGREARVQDFDRRKHIEHRMLRKILTNASCYAVAAAGEAFHDAGVAVKPSILERTGLWVGSLGLDQDFNTFTDGLKVSLTPDRHFDSHLFAQYGMSLIDPLFLVKSLPNSGLCGIAIQYGIKSSNLNIMNGPVSGLEAISAATAEIQSGRIDCALAGGYDCLLQLETAINHILNGSLPLGEGAAFVFLESEAHAQARSARVYGEVVASGRAHSVATPMTFIAGAEGLKTACCQSINSLNGHTAPLDAVFGDGPPTEFQDKVESEALTYLRENWPAIQYISATAALGYCGIASSIFSTVHSLLSLQGETTAAMSRALVWSTDRGFDHATLLLGRYEPATNAGCAGEDKLHSARKQ